MVTGEIFQQYRLFLRYRAPSQVVVWLWVNNGDTKRDSASGDDAYRAFRKMLESGHPPNDCSELLAGAGADGQSLQQVAAGIAP